MMGKPKIRFKGYNEDWEQRKFGEVFEFQYGEFNNNPDNGGEYPIYGANGIIGGYTDWNAENSSIIGHMGAYAGYVVWGEGKHFVTYNGTIARPKDNSIDSKYGYYLLDSKKIYKICAGSGQPFVSYSDLNGIDILLPKDKDEQRLLAYYFTNLDHLITLHHRECIILRKTKVNDWEQRKFSELYEKNVEKNTELVGYDKTISIATMTYKDEGNGASDKSLKSYKVLRTGDLAFEGHTNKDFRYGRFVANDIGTGIMSPRFSTLRPVKDMPVSFWKYYIHYEPIMRSVLVNSTKAGTMMNELVVADFMKQSIRVPSIGEQEKIGEYFSNLDNLITLHHRECIILRKTKVNDWEQRKLGETKTFFTDGNYGEAYPKSSDMVDSSIGVPFLTGGNLKDGKLDISGASYISKEKHELLTSGHLICDDIVIAVRGSLGALGYVNSDNSGWNINSQLAILRTDKEELNGKFLLQFLLSENGQKEFLRRQTGTALKQLPIGAIKDVDIPITSIDEQVKIGEYFATLDHLITLHHHEEFCTENVLIYIEINITIQIKEDIMAELESVIEQKLIDQLVYGDSQWIYRADLKTEEDLWNNFRYILEQNNKDRLNGEPLSDTEFEQVKNQLQFSSFYKAGEWLVGENGKVMVHVQRDTERLHLVVMNHEHIAGGSSVYEVINQYRALADEESQTKAQDRRFDVTLMIDGLPMIHIELKNKQHSYMDGFWQIKKYIGEGKFTGIFSAVQMFVISNGVDTKYFSAASDTELNPKFISGWLDNENNPVPDYLDFAKSVLRIPEAHEMIARYTVLDEEAKRLILLRPYQIHAIEAIREASKTGKSGFVWHTTGSGKTLTSYKATRNLLMDIPSIDKAIFLIDRKDLDTQTSMAFQAYANNDLVDVDETDNVFDLKKKLKSDDRQMIVTTIQKLQRLITKKLAEGTPEYNKIKSLKIAFVVDECHRAVTPGTKRELERFFANSLWYGFTGTPRFAENPYPQLGDLPRTTEELYGERLHRYTIQNAIYDNAVLGFQVEHNGPKNMDDETDSSMYENETHMLRVLDVILNKSYHKLGFQNGKGKTYEGLLTTSSIQLAQKYYELLKRVKNGETELQIDEKMKQILPDFPKFAITYSVTENEEGSHLNQEKMKESINDYNEMFGTKLDISQIQSYNANLNKRLARKEPKFQSRSEQLDLVIVVDRLLTGFDAPCMSTLFVDRQPMGPHDLIQAFSRTNRIFDKNKTYGQIVTFQAPKLFKECVDNAVKLYSAGSTEIALLAEWEEIEPAFRKALKALRVSAETPAEIPAMSEKEKVLFVKAFQNFDKLFAQLKSFTQYEDSMLTEYGISRGRIR